jgi:transposase
MPLIRDIQEEARVRRTPAAGKRPSQKGGRYAAYVPDDIERIETTVYPENYDEKSMAVIGYDRNERLFLRPSSFYVSVEKRAVCRPREAGPTDPGVSISEAPPRKQTVDCFVAASLLAEIITSKFAYHQPEYRQCARWKEHGISIPTSTVNGWVHRTADALYPLYRLQAGRILESPYIQVDETGVQVADRRGYLWGSAGRHALPRRVLPLEGGLPLRLGTGGTLQGIPRSDTGRRL